VFVIYTLNIVFYQSKVLEWNLIRKWKSGIQYEIIFFKNFNFHEKLDENVLK
jgi:hypothetical protein